MITLTKNGGVKVISEESTLVQALKDDGWVMEGEDHSVDLDLAELRAVADEMGIKYHHKAKAKTIAKLIEGAA